MKDILRVLIQFAINYFVIATVIDIILMGMFCLRFSRTAIQERFIIKRANRIDIQEGFRCSAYASAFVLWHFGIEADGNELYEKMPSKKRDGTVYPQGIQKLLSQYGFRVNYCAGNLNALKNELCKGNPVIVFIRVRTDKNWLHFVPVIGYDTENIYIAESLQELVNCDAQQYNRKISNAEFMRLWNTSMLKAPLYRNTYLTIEET